jgi:hypothetical protein
MPWDQLRISKMWLQSIAQAPDLGWPIMVVPQLALWTSVSLNEELRLGIGEYGPLG